MATGFLAILDDIAMLMDDTAAMSKIAAKKTAALLGDDLAVNAEKATGFHASRELPVLWAITKGSLLNKIIILPLAFLLSAYAPWLIVPILLLGGAYLSYEGTEKVWEWLFHRKNNSPKTIIATTASTSPAQNEFTKIKAAIRTDFILSIEIVIIALETVIEQSFVTQILVVSLIALAATIGVYGLVALLVRMDDMGFYLQERARHTQGSMAKATHFIGKTLVAALPKVIRVLAFVGTIAMLLVGGGMYVHNIEWIHQVLANLPLLVAELLSGLIIGSILIMGLRVIHTFRSAP